MAFLSMGTVEADTRNHYLFDLHPLWRQHPTAQILHSVVLESAGSEYDALSTLPCQFCLERDKALFANEHVDLKAPHLSISRQRGLSSSANVRQRTDGHV
jgi:hypothetical protein